MNETPLVNIQDGGITIAEHAVLQGVNLAIGPGELVYLIGKTGTGKSSLLRCLYGELSLSQGTGTVCGHDLKSITRQNVHTLRRDLGIVFQDFALLPDRTAHDNLDFVLGATGWSKGAARENRIQACLDAVGLGQHGCLGGLDRSLVEGDAVVAVALPLLDDLVARRLPLHALLTGGHGAPVGGEVAVPHPVILAVPPRLEGLVLLLLLLARFGGDRKKEGKGGEEMYEACRRHSGLPWGAVIA